MADHERGRDRRAHDGPPDMDDVVSASLLVVEFTVQAEAMNDSRVTDPRARLKAAAGAGAAASLKGPQSYKRLGGTVHLSSVEVRLLLLLLLILLSLMLPRSRTPYGPRRRWSTCRISSLSSPSSALPSIRSAASRTPRHSIIPRAASPS